MVDPLQFARVGDENSVDALSRTLSLWEPRLELISARDNPMIYEPDGTIYAAAVPPASRLMARHKTHPFLPGDVAVILRAVAIDAEEPGATYVAVRHDGTPPYHFRERFIQTWGYEHRPHDRDGSSEIIPEDDPRYRVSYRRSFLVDRLDSATGLDMHLWVGLEGTGAIATERATRRVGFGPGDLILIRDGVDYSVEGHGVAGRFLLCVESSYEAKLASSLDGRGPGINPEFHPGV